MACRRTDRLLILDFPIKIDYLALMFKLLMPILSLFLTGSVYPYANLQRYIVDSGIQNIVLNLEGNSIIEFINTENVFQISEVISNEEKALPIHVSESRTTLVMTLPANDHLSFSAKYKLYIPRDRNIFITSSSLIMKGNIEANSLTVNTGDLEVHSNISAPQGLVLNAGSIDFNSEVKRTKFIKIKTNSISGKVILSKKTRVTGLPFVNELRISRI